MAKAGERSWFDLGAYACLGATALFLAFVPALHDQRGLSYRTSAYIGAGLTILAIFFYWMKQNEDSRKEKQRRQEQAEHDRELLEKLREAIRDEMRRRRKSPRLAIMLVARDLLVNLNSSTSALPKSLLVQYTSEPLASNLDQAFIEALTKHPDAGSVLAQARQDLPFLKEAIEKPKKQPEDIRKIAEYLTTVAMRDGSTEFRAEAPWS